MGNQLAAPQKPSVEHLAELPNVVLKDTLGEDPLSRPGSRSLLACCMGCQHGVSGLSPMQQLDPVV